MSNRWPGIPGLNNIDPKLLKILRPMKEILENIVGRGGPGTSLISGGTGTGTGAPGSPGAAGSDGDDAVQYYIKPIDGTAIRNGVGSITIEAHKITGASDLLLSSGAYKLYEGSTDVGYSKTYEAADISGSIVVSLKDGPSGTVYDTITLVDVTDGDDGDPGTPGEDVVLGYIEPTNGLAWRRAKDGGAWSPATNTTQLDCTFVKAGSEVARVAILMTLNTSSGIIAGTTGTHSSGDLNGSRVTISYTNNNTASVTGNFAYSYDGDASSVSETVLSVEGGDTGSTGPAGPGGYDPSTDMTTPPEPTGLVAHGLTESIVLEWDAASYTNHDYTNVYRNAGTNNFADGGTVLLGTAGGSLYNDTDVSDGTNYYYWIEFISLAGVDGPEHPGATNGALGTVNLITDTVITPGGISTPSLAAGTITAASGIIADLAVVTAKIDDAAITSLKIAQIIQSDNWNPSLGLGWLINKLGEATFSEITVLDSTGTIILNSGGQYNPAISNVNMGSRFLESWSNTNADDYWYNWDGDGEISFVSDGVSGGESLSVGNNSGNDQVWLALKHNIPFDPTVLYQVRVRAKNTAGSSNVAYFGWMGIAADGVTKVSTSGGDTFTNQHYHCASNNALTSSFVEYVGYTQGHGATVGTGGVGTLESPGQMHPSVRFIRPLLLLNYNAAAGTMVVDYFLVEKAADVTTMQLAGTGVNIVSAEYSSFESSSLPDVFDSGGSSVLDATQQYYGSNSLKNTSSGASSYMYLAASSSAYNIPLTPNKKWILSCWTRCDTTSANAEIILRTATGNYIVAGITHSTANTWKQISGVVDLTSDSQIECMVVLANKAGSGQIVWFDGIMVEEQIGTLTTPSAFSNSVTGPQAPSWLTDPVIWSGNKLTDGTAGSYLESGSIASTYIKDLYVEKLVGDVIERLSEYRTRSLKIDDSDLADDTWSSWTTIESFTFSSIALPRKALFFGPFAVVTSAGSYEPYNWNAQWRVLRNDIQVAVGSEIVGNTIPKSDTFGCFQIYGITTPGADPPSPPSGYITNQNPGIAEMFDVRSGTTEVFKFQVRIKNDNSGFTRDFSLYRYEGVRKADVWVDDDTGITMGG